MENTFTYDELFWDMDDPKTNDFSDCIHENPGPPTLKDYEIIRDRMIETHKRIFPNSEHQDISDGDFHCYIFSVGFFTNCGLDVSICFEEGKGLWIQQNDFHDMVDTLIWYWGEGKDSSEFFHKFYGKPDSGFGI